ncbi:peptidase M15-like protein [Alteromonadaceae bacterium 2753L.S.0a.02]|nr:peptidase M15-like protein [Alteromonadaceae bacterium 2753L.S.0a.02]
MQMQLSENFWLSEFLQSQTAERKPEVAGDQFNPPHHIVENLRYLCENTLQPLRTLLQTPLRISSGYRSVALNTAIGGSATSQHTKGEAADLIMSDRILEDPRLERQKEVIKNLVYERTGNWIKRDANANFYLFAAGCIYLDNLDVDQLIHEYGTPGKPSWVHISGSTARNKREILRISREGTERLDLKDALNLGCATE